MRRIVFSLMLVSSLFALSACGRLKDHSATADASQSIAVKQQQQPPAQDIPLPPDMADNSTAPVPLNVSQATVVKNDTTPIVTSAPMFTPKVNPRRPNTDRIISNSMTALKGGMPTGYHGPVIEEEKPEPAVEEPKVEEVVDENAVEAQPVPSINTSYSERQMLDRVDRYKASGKHKTDMVEYDEKSGVYVSGDIAEQIFFDHASAAISPKQITELRGFAREMAKSDKDYKVSVVGHASKRVEGVSDPEKRSEVNYKMASKRAHAVEKELEKHGVESDAIIAVSKGADEPNPNPGKKGQEAADRRVDVYVDDKKSGDEYY